MSTNLTGGSDELGGALNEAVGEIRSARAPDGLGRGMMERAAGMGVGRDPSDLALTAAQWRVVGQGVAVMAILGVVGMSIWAIGGLSVVPHKETAKEAAPAGDVVAAGRLRQVEEILDRARLVREDTLCQESLSEAERRWLRQTRPTEASHWNLLTDLKAQLLPYAA